MINHPWASNYHGKDNHPNTERQDRQRRDPNDLGNPCEGGGGTIPLGGSGGMNPNNRYTMKMDSRFHHLGRFSLAASHKAAVAERFVQRPRDDPFDFVALLLQAVPTGFQNSFAVADGLQGEGHFAFGRHHDLYSFVCCH